MPLFRSSKAGNGGGTGGTDVYIDGVKSSASRVDLDSLQDCSYLGNASIVVYDNKIHIMGGTSEPTRHISWDGTTWDTVSTLPFSAMSGACTVVYNNEIHILYYLSSPYHYKWNGTTWSEASTLPYNVIGACAVVYNNEIHLLGGGTTEFTNHYKWNGTTWSEVSTLPYEFYTGSVLVYNNQLHLINSSTTNNYIAHYVFDNGVWVKLDDTLFGHCRNCVVYNNEIYGFPYYTTNNKIEVIGKQVKMVTIT